MEAGGQNVALSLVYPGKNLPLSTGNEAGWDPGPVWTLWRTGKSKPDRRACSLPLYRLSYTAFLRHKGPAGEPDGHDISIVTKTSGFLAGPFTTQWAVSAVRTVSSAVRECAARTVITSSPSYKLISL